MPPKTRTGGAPPANRVYHSTPALQQTQFPPRRQTVRTYGRRRAGASRSFPPSSSAAAAAPSSTAPPSSSGLPRERDARQRTLTQIDFVSLSTPPVVLSDSEEDLYERSEPEPEETQVAGDKENEAKGKTAEEGKDKGKADNKRRRTVGETAEPDNKRSRADSSRRRTLGDSAYHTQTLTQFMGRDLVQDSQDEDDEADGQGVFDDWLGSTQDEPSPRQQDAQQQPFDTVAETQGEVEASPSKDLPSRPSSVPQTPSRGIRFEIPSSSQASTPFTGRMLDRYGPPDGDKPSPSIKRTASQASTAATAPPLSQLPGKPSARKLVVEDSFATESWGSSGAATRTTPLKDITAQVVPAVASSSATDLMSTPTRPGRRGASAELGEVAESTDGEGDESPGTPTPRPVSRVRPEVFEIPDSDDDEPYASEEDVGQDEEEVVGQDEQEAEESQGGEQPEQDEQDENVPASPQSPADKAPLTQDDGEFTAGAETQFAMNELSAGWSHQLPPLEEEQEELQQQQHQQQHQQHARPLRRPISHLPSSQSQPLESQRVPLSTIQALGAPTNRTDILVPIAASTIAALATGYAVHLTLPHKVPRQVTRFWLVDEAVHLCYCACVGDAQPQPPAQGQSWTYPVTQVYELNNPLDEDDMDAEGWIEKGIRLDRYTYLPPAGVAQLLSNLRHALFGPDDQMPPSSPVPSPAPAPAPAPPSSSSVSEAVEAQLRSDMSAHHPSSSRPPPSSSSARRPPPPPSTAPRPDPEDDVLVPSTPLKRRRQIHASQATTASQPSTPPSTRRQQHQHQQPLAPPPVPPASASASSRQHQHQQHSGTPSTLQNPSSPIPVDASADVPSSQLLTRSQMLPDSLLRDDAVPPDIWDSEPSL